MIKIEVIKNEQEFKNIAKDWDELLEKSSSNIIYLNWKWLYTWYTIFKKDRELNILLVYENEELIGIAPLIRRTIKKYGLLTIRRLEFLATGEDAEDEICSLYLDIIFQIEKEKLVFTAIYDHLFNNSDSWDEIVLLEVLRPEKYKKYFQGNKHKISIYHKETSYYVDLPDSWQAYMDNFSAKRRKTINNGRNRLKKNETFELYITDCKEKIYDDYYWLAKLHQMRQKTKNSKGVFASKKFNQFHKDILEYYFDKNQILLFFIKIQNEPVGVLYSFLYNGVILAYQTGFNPEILPTVGVGKQTFHYSIEYGIENKFHEFDMQVGAENSYKAEWSPSSRKLYGVQIYGNSLKANIAKTLDSIIANAKLYLKSILRIVREKLEPNSKKQLPDALEE
jgi:hypothetical protein